MAVGAQSRLELETEKHKLENLVFALVEHTARTLKQIDQLALLIQLEHARDARFSDALQLVDRVGLKREGVVPHFGVIDQDGILVWSSRQPFRRINLADREHFMVHIATDSGAAYVGPPVLGRDTGKWALHFSRRISKPDGSFGGVVVVAVEPTYFSTIYGNVNLGKNGSVLLVGADGIVRAQRSVDGTIPLGGDIFTTPMFAALRATDSGTVVIPGVDGVERMWSFRRIDGFPSLRLLVATGMDDLLLVSNRNRQTALIGTAIASLLIVWFSFALGLAIVRQQRAAADLQANEERFRRLIELSTDWYWEQDEQLRYTLMSGNPFVRSELLLGKRRWETGVVPVVGDWPEHQAILEAHQPFRDYQLYRDLPNGDRRYMSVDAEPMFDADGRFTGYRGIVRDVTAAKRAEQLLKLEHTVARCLAESGNSSAALKAVMRVVCETQRWQCGRYWRIDDAAGVMRFGEGWSVPETKMEQFIERSRTMTLRPGVGLAGTVWVSGEPLWVADVTKDSRVHGTGLARDVGVRGAFLFPVISEAKTIGVLNFSSREVREPDERLLQAVRVIGSQVGQFLQRKQAEEVLQESEDRFRHAVAGSQAGIWDWNLKGGSYYLSARYKEILGYRDDELPNDRAVLLAHLHPEDCDRMQAALQRHMREHVPFEEEVRIRRKDGNLVWVRTAGQAVWGPDGEVERLTGSVYDITDRKVAEERAQRLLAEQNAIFEAATTGIAFLKERTIIRCNPRFAEMFGYERDELVGKSTAILHGSPELFDERGADAYVQINRGASVQHEFEMLRKDGSHMWITGRLAPIDAGDPDRGVVWSVEDITDLKRTEEQLAQLAHYDSLTGLPNRVLLRERLAHALAAIPRADRLVGLLFIDLDRFKVVNDTLGHAAGDELLQLAAHRLRATTRGTDTLARLGGDEFALVLPDMRDAKAAGRVAEKVLRRFAQPFVVGSQELHVTTSIGIAVAPTDGVEVDELIKNADVAMYRAKSEGRNALRYYAPEMNARALGLLTLENELRRALERREFCLYYQPRVEVRTGHVSGVEALLRWQKDGALVSPGEFIPLLEETGLIVPVGEWVLAEACRQAVEWTAQGTPALRVAVNVSARQFARTDFAQTVERVLAETGLAADRLEIELTESTVMQDAEHAVYALQRLKQSGARVAIDDFGTGYSSLAYLKRFAVDELKIDRSFVKDLPADANDAALTTAIIAMAHSLGISLTAEGVETEAQRAFLERSGCDAYQGFLYSRPVPATVIPSLVGVVDADLAA